VKHLLTSLICAILIFSFGTQVIPVDGQEDDPIPTSEIIIDTAGICPEYPGGLAVPPQVDNIDEAEIEEAKSWGGEVGRGMFPENIRQIYGLYVYGVDAETPLTVNYNINYFGNREENPDGVVPLRYFALLDEQFIPLGASGTLNRDVTLPLDQNFTLPIPLPALSPGLHDLVVIGIARPDTGPIRLASIHEGDSQLLSSRITLIAGDPAQILQEDPRNYTRLTEGLPELERPTDAPYPAILAVLGRRFGPWTWDEGTSLLKLPPNTEVNYAIHLAYYGYVATYEPTDEEISTGEPNFINPDSTRFALILFEGAQPVPIVGDDLVFYGEVPRDIYFGRVEMKTTAPAEGLKNLVPVRIDNPGQSLCKYIDTFGFGIYATKVTIEVDTGE
jgi:hypothetical protein